MTVVALAERSPEATVDATEALLQAAAERGVDLVQVASYAQRSNEALDRNLTAGEVERACAEAVKHARQVLVDAGMDYWQAAQEVHEAATGAVVPVGLLGQRVELGDLMRKGVPRPKFLPSGSLGERMFYERSLFIVSGHKKSGKSWAMLTTALDCLRDGRPAVYVDFENGRDRFARRLLQLGVDPSEAEGANGLHYLPFPSVDGDSLRDGLEEIAEALPQAFVVIDSLRGLIARVGGREPNVNDPQVIERATAPLREAVDAHGLTVGVIDHAKMTGSDSDEYATANSAAKEQAVDAVYFWTKVDPYNRDVAGTVKLKTTDDRDGELVFERYWRIGGQGDDTLSFTPTEPSEVGLGRILEDVRQYLADHAGKPQTKTTIRKGVRGENTKIDEAINYLVGDPSEPIHARSEGNRPPHYVWDEDATDGTGGLAF